MHGETEELPQAMTAKLHRVGTHRVSPPEETRRRIWPLLRPFGISRVANITGLDYIGIPVVVVCRPNSKSLSVSMGKGTSLVCAEVSGAMESIEFYHAEHVSEPLLLGSHNQLRFTRNLLPPEVVPKSAVGRFHEDLKIHWIEAVDLLKRESCWVPYELVHTDFTLPLPAGSGCFPMTSNGLASGNHLYEAVSHGIAEVVERDAETLFGLLPESERSLRRIRLDSVDASECRELLSRFAAAGIHVAVWDITSDLGIAAFRAVIMDEDLKLERPLRPNVGMGCHPSRAIALSRALTEAAQSRLTLISSSRDDLPRERYSDAEDLERLQHLRKLADAGTETRSFLDVPTFEADDIESDLSWQKERLAERGFERLLVVDLTKREFDIPVVRVIVPGLEPSRETPGWVPGTRARRVVEGDSQ